MPPDHPYVDTTILKIPYFQRSPCRENLGFAPPQKLISYATAPRSADSPTYKSGEKLLEAVEGKGGGDVWRVRN